MSSLNPNLQMLFKVQRSSRILFFWSALLQVGTRTLPLPMAWAVHMCLALCQLSDLSTFSIKKEEFSWQSLAVWEHNLLTILYCFFQSFLSTLLGPCFTFCLLPAFSQKHYHYWVLFSFWTFLLLLRMCSSPQITQPMQLGPGTLTGSDRHKLFNPRIHRPYIWMEIG